jgi:hypothetical protein
MVQDLSSGVWRMVWSIERIWRVIPKRPLVPTMMLVVAVNTPDPNRRGTGYGGVLPVPSPTVTVQPASGRVDPLLDQQRRDTRAIRGRVLYAAGHAPRDTAAAHAAPARKGPCPDQRIGQGRAPSAMPNS